VVLKWDSDYNSSMDINSHFLDLWNREEKKFETKWYGDTYNFDYKWIDEAGGWASEEDKEEAFQAVIKRDLEGWMRDQRIKDEEKEMGDDCTVVRGKKVPQGTKGRIFWMKEVPKYHSYGRDFEWRAGIKDQYGDVHWLPLCYLMKDTVEYTPQEDVIAEHKAYYMRKWSHK